ncbi:MAG: SDR family NAD(P)-dependent oxidoreductase [Syntrophomonadaceae bacterium]|nr:SDR family NAD(P)-dependent oxidoreductase [Syntrophomonadaceae bacterium]
MKVLVTGGAGFIGRWLVKRLLNEGYRVTALDDLSNGQLANIEEFTTDANFTFIQGDIKDIALLDSVFEEGFGLVYHLAASINVQDSIDDPRTTFDNDVVGTFNVLEQCRKIGARVLFMSTCMVYDRSLDESGISETHPVKPASPYAASKLAGEALTLSYYYAYGLPAVVVRPFNTYGPFQKASGEGGVVAIFIKRSLEGEPLNIYGEGTQTRDLLYVEDCADFIYRAAMEPASSGLILNAGLGKDIAINDLALLIGGNPEQIKHVPHIHPQSEIPKLLCNYSQARSLLKWQPAVSLEEGLLRTRAWISGQEG